MNIFSLKQAKPFAYNEYKLNSLRNAKDSFMLFLKYTSIVIMYYSYLVCTRIKTFSSDILICVIAV